MKLKVLALAVAAMATPLLAGAAYLDENTGEVITTAEQGLLGATEEEKINYGDPTASFTGFGVEKDVSGDNKGVRGTFVYGLTEGGTSHIVTAELGTDDFNGGIDYRARYFNVDQCSGFGWSIDGMGGYQSLTQKRDGVKGHTANNTLMAGVVQKFQVTDNIMVVPMLYGGNMWLNAKVNGFKENDSTLVAQGGIYTMYGFDAGHWIYANPKTTYVKEAKGFNNQIEIGGGYMIADNQSLGFKVDVSKFSKIVDGVDPKTETKGSINYYYYF